MQKFEFEVPALEESKFGAFVAGESLYPDGMEGEGGDGLWDPGRTVKTAGIVSGGFFMPFFQGFTQKNCGGGCICRFYKVYYRWRGYFPYIK